MKAWLVALLLAVASACDRPNLEPTEGGYRRADTMADTAGAGRAARTSD